MFLNASTSTKSELDMALIPLPKGVENVKFTRAGTGKKKQGKFDSAKEKVLADLDVGIREAQGRYMLTDENTQGAASSSNPVLSNRLVDKDKNSRTMLRPYASTCWAPQMKMVESKDRTKGYEPRIDEKSGQELVRVYIKCKGAKVEELLSDMGGNPQTDLQILAGDLVATLESYRDALAEMTKENELGKYWHSVAVYNSFPPKQRASQDHINNMAHCLEVDRWVRVEDVKQESPYPSNAITPRVEK